MDILCFLLSCVCYLFICALWSPAGKGLTSWLSFVVSYCELGAQWLSGRVLDSRPKGRGFEPHRRHCVVVLEQDTFILA